MIGQKEKLRVLLAAFDRAEKVGAAGEHLRDADFIRLIESKKAADGDGNSFAPDEFAALRKHLSDCALCLDEFQNFYAFFAPAEANETPVSKREIAASWQSFAAHVGAQKPAASFWRRLFPDRQKFNYSAALGWGLAAVFLLAAGIGFYTARQARSENTQLAAQLENQQRQSETNPNTFEEPKQNDVSPEFEKARLENDEAQKQIARLQNELERAQRRSLPDIKDDSASTRARKNRSSEKSDDLLAAVNTPIYDVYPADLNVRGDEQSANNLTVPESAKTVVLILNAAGRAVLPNYRVELTDNAGKTIWRAAGLRKDSTGNFTLTLTGALLKEGNYRLRIFGADKTTSQTVAAYSFRIDIK